MEKMQYITRRNVQIINEAASPEATEIKTAVSNMKAVVRKYAKDDKAIMQEMIKSLSDMEKDLKALAKPAKAKKMNESVGTKPETYDEFEERSDEAFNNWGEKDIYMLIANNKIPSPNKAVRMGMTQDEAFDKYWDIAEEEFQKKLNIAVGGDPNSESPYDDWLELGMSFGLTDEDVESIYMDRYQGKTDPFVSAYTNVMEALGAPEY